MLWTDFFRLKYGGSDSNPPAMRETRGPSLGWKDALEGGMATHSSLPAWRIPMDRGAWRAPWGATQHIHTGELQSAIFCYTTE